MAALGPDVKDVVISVLGCSIMLLVLFGLFRDAISGKFLSQARSIFDAVCQTAHPCHVEADDEVSQIVQTKVQNQKLEHFRTSCQILSVCFIAVSIMPMWLFLTGDETCLYTFPQMVVHVSVHAVFALIYFCPGIIVSRNIDFVYFFFAIGLTAWISPIFCAPGMMMMAVIIGNLCLVILTLMRRSLLAVASANLAYAISASSLIWAAHGHGFIQRPTAGIFIQCAGILFVTGIAHLLEIQAQAMLRQSVEMQATRQMLVAASALLRSCCDVLVELDAHGRIASPSKDLGSFLLRGPDHCLQGWLLSDLISQEEDRSKFQDALSAQTPAGLADALHVHMKDGNGKVLQLELLLFQFCGLGSQPNYLVGLREFSDSHARCGQEDGQSHQEAAAPANEDTFAFGEKPYVSTRSLEDSLSLTESGPSSTSSVEESFVEAVLDASIEGLLIKECSPGFAARIGHMASNTHLVALLKKPHKFESWLQTSLNLLVNGLCKEQLPAIRVTLNMPQGTLKATCRIVPKDAAQEKDGENEDDQEPVATVDVTSVRVRFSKISLCRSHCKRATDLKGTPVSHMSL